ncbi:hypothetical protein K474DRAFT_1771230 [Panus rudis PR-1116 ss-1]|nr:hypothetical protein K474DRAFT_1771230 [Panus rudis PR-1116 ss-1]
MAGGTGIKHDEKPSEPTVASFLGIKGPLRFRPHGATQKAHVVLRKVDYDGESDDEDESHKNLVYFSLFAQKRIEVKPGKEILLAIETPDGRYIDTPVLFAGEAQGQNGSAPEDLASAQESSTILSTPPPPAILPPRMRKTWTKPPDNAVAMASPQLPERRSVGVQCQLTYSTQAIQTTAEAVAPRVSSLVQTECDIEPVALADASVSADEVVTRTNQIAEAALKSQESRSEPIMDRPCTPEEESEMELSDAAPASPASEPYSPSVSVNLGVNFSTRDRSLSPMELDSPGSSPTLTPAVASVRAQDKRPKSMSFSPPELRVSTSPSSLPGPGPDVHISPLHLSPDSSDPPGLDIPSFLPPVSPAPAEQLTSNRHASRTDSPQVADVPGTEPERTLSTERHSSGSAEPAPYKPRRKPIPNPFVSGGLLTDFVSGSTQNTPTPTESRTGLPSKPETVTSSEPRRSHNDSIPPPISVRNVSPVRPASFVRGSPGASTSRVKVEDIAPVAQPVVRPPSPPRPSASSAPAFTPAAVPIISKPVPPILPPPPVSQPTSPVVPLVSQSAPPIPPPVSQSVPPMPPPIPPYQFLPPFPPQREPFTPSPSTANLPPPPLSAPTFSPFPPISALKQSDDTYSPLNPTMNVRPQLQRAPSPPQETNPAPYVPAGTYTNPLGIRPSARPPPPPMNRNAEPRPSPPSTGKRPVVVGNGWPHNRTNGTPTRGNYGGGYRPNSNGANNRYSTNIDNEREPASSWNTSSPVDSWSQPSGQNNEPQMNGHRPSYDANRYAPSYPAPPSYNLYGQQQSGTPGSSQYPSRAPSTDLPSHSPNTSQYPIHTPAPPDRPPAIFIPQQQQQRSQPNSAQAVTPTHPLPPKPPAFAGGHTGNSWSPRQGLKRMASPPPEMPQPELRYTRSLEWPTIEGTHTATVKGDNDTGIISIVFNSDGSQFAIACHDRTVRIWNNRTKLEIARLGHTMPVIAVAWMEHDSGVVTLGDNGIVSTWTRNAQNKWQWAKILDASGSRQATERPTCLAFGIDRIAIAYPTSGVKMWLFIKGTWLPQRSILRSNVAALKFVHDGDALIGATTDGVLWYNEFPNGTLKALTFMQSKVCGLDVENRGSPALVTLSNGKCELVKISQDDLKGTIEQTFAFKEGQSASCEYGALFTNKSQAVLFGALQGCVMVWERSTAEIMYGMSHGEDDVIQAVSYFEGGPSSAGQIITGTRKGQLTWFTEPTLDAQARKRAKVN